MAKPHEPQRVFFPFSNPLRKILRSTYVPNPTLPLSLKTFESALSDRFDKLNPKKEGPLDMGWMRAAIEALLETHTEVSSLISELCKPLINWEEHWVSAYLDLSMRLLDMCNAFSSEISHLTQFHLLLRHALHTLEQQQPSEKKTTMPSLDEHTRHHNKLYSPFSDAVVDSLRLIQKRGCSGKEKVVMRAMYGMNVFTIFVYRVFMAKVGREGVFSWEYEVGRRLEWGEAFDRMVKGVGGRGLEEVEKVKKGGCWEERVRGLRKEEERLGIGIKGLREVVDGGFHLVFQRREELLSCIRDNFFGSLNLQSPSMEDGKDL